MYKFKVSKYKNVITQIPKKTEGWITDNVSVNNINGYSNLLKTSAAIVAYYCDGGNIGIKHINSFDGKPSILKAHGSDICDFDFSPFDDGILASCSKNGQIKVWQFQEIFPELTVPNNPIFTLTREQSIDLIQFHPSVDTILTTASDNHIQLWDVTKSEIIYESPECSVQSFNWKHDGGLLVLSTNDSQINIWDPRIEQSKAFGLSFSGHENTRDSRVVWIGTMPYVISCGFNKRKAKESFLWDTRSNQKPVGTLCEFEPSTGVWIPLFDYDTNMLFLVGRNDSAVNHWDINDVINQPSNFDNNGTNKKMIDFQIKGATLTNKRALKVMETEVNRLYLLGSDAIAPLEYKVPRKSYRDFHADLFPDTKSPDCSVTLDDWKQLNNGQMETISLNPSINKGEKLIRLNVKLGASIRHVTSDKEMDQFLNICEKDGIDVNASVKTIVEKTIVEKPQTLPKPSPRNVKPEIDKKVETSVKSAQNPNPSPQRRGFTVRTTKFRHLKGNILGRETHITNFNGLCKTIPGECDVLKVNSKFAAIPIGPSCNQLAIINITEGKRLSGGVIPNLVCGHSIGDFAFDPFDETRIAVGCDNGTIQLWNIPSDGLIDNMDNYVKFVAHNDRLTIIQFHPLASDVLASYANDMILIIWDLKVLEPKIRIDAHPEPVFGISWHPKGSLIATICKDQKVRLFNPRDNGQLVDEGPGPQGTRGARICWAQKGKMLIATGFSRVSERQFLIYNSSDLSTVIASEGLDVSPAILVPFYDEDSCTLFLSGKGDSTIFTFEISSLEDGPPYIHHLSHYNTPTPHQAVSYLYKNTCDVRKVEFARAYRLTTSSIEPISFTVPRLRNEYFQDDLFPLTKVLWVPTLSSSEWFMGHDKDPSFISLRPDNMSLLSEAPPPAPTKKDTDPQVQIQFEGDVSLKSSLAFLNVGREKQEMLVQQMSEKVDFNDDVLPQENYEGVDPQEWDESNEN